MKTIVITAERKYKGVILITYAFKGIGAAFYTDDNGLFEALRNEKRKLVKRYSVKVLFDVK